MYNIFTDKYFSKAKRVAEIADLNPSVSYRVFMRHNGLAALKPLELMVSRLCPSASIHVLPKGTYFEAGDTVAIIKGPFQDLVEYEPLWLWWTALPCYCALKASEIVRAAKGMDVMAFENRHNFGAEATALTSYGANVGGFSKFSADIGADALPYLQLMLNHYDELLEDPPKTIKNKGIGTTPHALIALFEGDYAELCRAYKEAYPEDKYVILNDYNNKEIDDSLTSLQVLGHKLYAVRLDTCGENYAQLFKGSPSKDKDKGVTPRSVKCLREELDKAGGQRVKICASSGFNAEKTELFTSVPLDSVGTGSFIPKWPTATADIFEVDGKKETKVGREWGYIANEKFWRKVT